VTSSEVNDVLKPFRALVIIAATGVAACRSAAIVTPSPTVSFVFAPQACSSIVPVQFFIDGLQVATDTFRVGVTGGDHLASRGIATSPGRHVLGARTDRFTWPDMTVTLAAGQAFTDSLPFYCS
jgi:hypothetical protein